jgi:hypothetical protein
MNSLTDVEEGDVLLIDGVEYPVNDVTIGDIGITQVVVIASHRDGQKRLIETTTANNDVQIVDVDNETYWTGMKSEIQKV